MHNERKIELLSKEDKIEKDLITLFEKVSDIDSDLHLSISNIWKEIDRLVSRLTLLENREANRIRANKAHNIIKHLRDRGKDNEA